MMRRVAILGQADSQHTERWTRWLASAGNIVTVFSDTPARDQTSYPGIPIAHPHWTLWRKIYAFKVKGGTYANNWHKWMAYRDGVNWFDPHFIIAMEARAYGPMLKHFPKVPRILMPWGTDMRCLDPDDLALKRPEESKLVRQAVDNSDIITTNAPGRESRWARISKLPENRFVLSAWGIDPKIFFLRRGNDESTILPLPGLEGRPRILLSARLAQENYHITDMMAAWNDLKVERTDEVFVILRAGASDEAWRQVQHFHADHPDTCTLLIDRYFTSPEMAAIYNMACGFIMYPDDDLLAQSLLEGAACGAIPVVRDIDSYSSLLARDGFFSIKSHTGEIQSSLRGMIRDWLKLTPEKAAGHRAANAAVVAENYRWHDLAPRIMESVFTTATENFAKRTAG